MCYNIIMEKIELLSPVGDFECLKSAIQNGADSVYLGASSFSARAKATNFDFEELAEAIKYAKLRNVSVHLALNTLIKNDEFEDAINLAITAYNLGVDAIIVQDLGLSSYLLKNYPEIPIHASTQMTVHNLEGVIQLEKLGFSRVVLSRELSINEIEYIRKNTNIELEVFIHGALCISYSGQCLLSSMIGGRSGNRGFCAQPCRLPYELFEETENGHINSLDKGYLLSPRDILGIEFLPEIIKGGINSLKIEGRMKTPTYVGVVTRIYRKYIDLVLNNINLDNKTLKNMINKNLNIKNPNTNLSDLEELNQVFNRGGFSTGHLSSNENKNLIFKDKPNNMGLYVGTISHINENKGHLKLKLENSLSVGDKISINNEIYTISELMIDNKNYESLDKGYTVKIGRMKGKISVSSKIYKLESSKLNKTIYPTFKENKEFKKINLNAKIIIKENLPISLKVWSEEGFYKNLEFTFSSIIPENALNNPTSKQTIIKQISKTGNTQFEFKNIDIVLDDNLFIPTSILNDLRRNAINGLENSVLQKYSHKLKNNFKPIKSDVTNTKKTISLLLNNIKNYDYTSLENINKLYIPLKYFLDLNYKTILYKLTQKFNTYIYMPTILKNTNINFKNIISNFKIKGFVVSHISQIELLKNFNLELIGNFTLNVYNNYSIEKLKELNISCITASPELNEIDNLETIVYGKIPVMTNNYCYLGKSNKCYSSCKKLCKSNSKFYLQDRTGSKFIIIPNNSITTIFNSKPIQLNNYNTNSIRIDILDETFEEIQYIINKS